jgi:hypothetical protein
MSRLHVSLLLIGVLVPGLASCASPAGRYQQALVKEQQGVPCFGVPAARDGDAPAKITGVSVMEVGSGGAAIWERDFLRDGQAEPTLAPDQCLRYGDGGTSPPPRLQPGKRYQVELWGSAPAKRGAPQSRWFNGYFCVVDSGGAPTVNAVLQGRDGTLRWDACGSAAQPVGRAGR